MDWIKANLSLVLSVVVALALLAGSGFYFYNKMAAERDAEANLQQIRAALADLQGKTPYPNEENLALILGQQKQLAALMGKANKFFSPVIPPAGSRKDDFGSLLQNVIAELQQSAQNANVILPTNFSFGFSVQKELLQHEKPRLETLIAQLFEIRALCEVLFQAKIYELSGIKRAPISTNDTAALDNHPQDYLRNLQIFTNDTVKAVIAPYEATVRCSSTELAAALEGLAKAPFGFIVKAIKVQPADSETTEEGFGTGTESAPSPAASMMARYYRGGMMTPAMALRYGLIRRPPPSAYALTESTVSPTPKKTGTGIVLKEKPLRVSLLINVVKLASTNEVALTNQLAAVR